MIEEDTSLFRIKNYNVHPNDRKYWVFFFSDHSMAEFFESLLKENSIEFEKDIREDLVKRELYGIHKRDLERVLVLNNIAIGKFRKPFIEDPTLRYVIIAISILAVGLGIYGFLNN